MKTMTLATALAVSLATTGLAMADNDHGHGAPQGAEAATAPMGGQADMMQAMMRMMMQMHGGMMGGAMMHGQGAGLADAVGMMDRDMMQMMMGSGMMGAGAPEAPDPEALRGMMMMRMGEFDGDRDGSMTLPEFEALHGAMMRETMVDRFQHLDADGDGRISGDEMGAPALRMQRTPGGAGIPGVMGGQVPPAGN